MNIHLTPTDKPSRLYYYKNNLFLTTESHFNVPSMKYQNIYITSDEEINLNDYITDGYRVWKWKDDSSLLGRKKVILSTDQDLIQDGVQDIDDDFLEWFVKNPSCEFIQTERLEDGQYFDYLDDNSVIEGIYENYKIIIPQEEPKQETLEEAAERLYPTTIDSFTNNGYDESIMERLRFKAGAKWQQERMYSEEDLLGAFEAGMMFIGEDKGSFKEWFEQFKKK
jgi:hypothetical protein